jgi:hypothetical protein
MLRATDRYLCWLIALLFATGIAGCNEWQQSAPSGKTLLKPIDVADDGMQLEIISIRFPLGDEALNKTMWSEIDEQQFPLPVRQALAENGFRAGVIGGQLPPALVRLLTEAEKQPAKISEMAARLQSAPAVSRRKLQLYSGWHGEIVASGVYPALPLLMREVGGVSGRTYPQAQGILGAKAQALGDRRVKVQLTPELHFGEPRQQWVSDDGMLRPQAGKPKRVFDGLALEAALAPGQMLVLTCLPDQPGTLGQYFFTEPLNTSSAEDPQMQQKLTVVRLADTRYSDLFGTLNVSGAEADPATDLSVVAK